MPEEKQEYSQGIDHRTNLDVREFRRDYLEPGIPVILAGAARSWPAMKKWTPEFFIREYGSKQIIVDGREYSLAEFVEAVLQSNPQSPSPYWSNVNVKSGFPELQPDIEPSLAYVFPNPLKDFICKILWWPKHNDWVEFYLGGCGSRFATLHFDNYFLHAFVTQIYGDKEFIVYAPDQTPKLYADGSRPSGHQRYHTLSLGDPTVYVSSIDDIFDPDLDRYPMLREAEACRFILRAGETVFLPAGWWHASRMLSPSISVSYNSINGDNAAQFGKTFYEAENIKPTGVTGHIRTSLAALTPFLFKAIDRF